MSLRGEALLLSRCGHFVGRAEETSVVAGAAYGTGAAGGVVFDLVVGEFTDGEVLGVGMIDGATLYSGWRARR
jgi:hypothetical protein